MYSNFPAPKAFIRYCDDVVINQKIKTIDDLKNFWLYAIKVGENNPPKMRDGIAERAICVADNSTIPGVEIGYHSKNRSIYFAYDYLYSYMHFDYDNPDNTSYNQWRLIKHLIEDISEESDVMFEEHEKHRLWTGLAIKTKVFIGCCIKIFKKLLC